MGRKVCCRECSLQDPLDKNFLVSHQIQFFMDYFNLFVRKLFPNSCEISCWKTICNCKSRGGGLNTITVPQLNLVFSLGTPISYSIEQ